MSQNQSSEFEVGRWSSEFLKEKSRETDPKGDSLVRHIFENGEQEYMHQLFKSLLVNKDLTKEPIVDQFLDNYFDDIEMPEWADQDKIKLG